MRGEGEGDERHDSGREREERVEPFQRKTILCVVKHQYDPISETYGVKTREDSEFSLVLVAARIHVYSCSVCVLC